MWARLWVLCVGLWCFAFASVAHAADLRFELVEAQMPDALPRGQTIIVPVVVRNLSDEAWDPAKKDNLAYHLYVPGQDEALVFDGLRTSLPDKVAPGATVSLDARLQVPEHEGPLVVEWAMVRESVRWYPRPVAGVTPRIERPLVEAVGTWSIEALESDELAIEGLPVTIRATLVNRGWITWDAARGDAVALHWYAEDGSDLLREGARASLPRRVAPGERVQVEWTTVPPPGLGRRAFGVEPVREGVQWYGPPVGDDLRATLVVEPSPFGWAIEGEFAAPELSALDELTVPVRLANVGESVWSTADRLSYQWLDDSGAIVGEGPRTTLPHPVPPGESLDLQARVIAPEEPGRYRLRWGMLRDGLAWYGPPQAGASKIDWTVDVGRPRLAFELVRAESPAFALTRDLREVEVTVKNVGQAVWDPQRGDSLAYHWLDADGEMAVFEGRRTHLPGRVLPGDEVTLEATVQLPREGGRYELVFEMVREQVRWYGDAASAGFARAWRAVPVYNCLLAIVFLLGCFVARELRRGGTRVDLFAEIWWVLWFGFAIGTLGISFAELSQLAFWKGGLGLAWSSAGWLALPLCFVAGRGKRIAAAGVLLFLGALTLADVIYMHFFGSIVPVSSLGHANHLGEVLGSAQTRFAAEQLWLFAPFVTAVVAAFVLPAPPAQAEVEPYRLPWKVRLALAVACALAALPAVKRLTKAMTSELGARVFSEQHNVQRFGVYNAHAFDVARALRETVGRRTLDDASRARVIEFFAQQKAFADEKKREHPEAFGVAKGKNLLLIQVEALQTWVIGAQIDGQELTPFMNDLRSEGLSFTTVIDQTAQGKTSDGEYLVLNSQHPLPRGATAFLRADNHFLTLAHALAYQGYTTSSAHPYRRGFWNRAVLHPRYGFASSVFKRELGEGQFVGWGLADGLFFERMLPRLEAAAQPWFAFWVTLSLHHPYDEFPDNLVGDLELGELEGTRLGNYIQGMNYFDRSLQQLVRDLDERGLLDDTVIALYGDHDARFELDEHPKLLEIAGKGVWTPSTFAVMEQVPFFVLLPDGALHGEIDTLGGQIDIGPTLLHLLGVERPASFVGHPLLPGLSREFAAYPNGSAYLDDRVFVRRGRDIPRGGACFFFPSGKPRPRADCDALAKRARQELGLSRAVTDTDMQRELAGVPADPSQD